MARASVLVRAERATVKRLQKLGGAATSQFEKLVNGAIKLTRGGRRTGKNAMRAINEAQKRADEISRRLTALKKALQKRGGAKKRVKRRKPARRAAPKRARRATTRRASRKRRIQRDLHAALPWIDRPLRGHRLAAFRGVSERTEKNPLNLIRVMPAKGQGTYPLRSA